MRREFWYHRNLRVFNGVFKSGECFPPHNSVFLLMKFGYFLPVLVRICQVSLHLWTTWTLVKYAVALHVRCEVKSTSLT